MIGSRRRFIYGRQLDSVMNYPFADSLINFAISGIAEGFNDRILEICENYLSVARKNGINTVFVPLFSLLEITKSGDEFYFSAEKLERFINLATGRGIKYFELSHFFTQWGAAATPKIMATVDGEYKRILSHPAIWLDLIK